jgi:hypothetical protein
MAASWRIGVFAAMLMLPAGLYALNGGALLYGGCFALKLVIEARYGMAGGACQHAAMPLTWRRLLGAAQQQQWQLVLPAFAQAVLLPLLLSWGWSWCGGWVQQHAAARSQHASAASSGGSAASSSSPSKSRAKLADDAECAAARGSAGPQSAGGGAQQEVTAVDGGSQSGDPDTHRQPDQLQQPETQLELAPGRRVARGVSLYRSPIGQHQHLLLHLKLEGSDAAAEEAFARHLPGTLASMVGEVQLPGGVNPAAALQLLQVASFPGVWGPMGACTLD